MRGVTAGTLGFLVLSAMLLVSLLQAAQELQ
jgi:hypothetical protein